jgi:CARDB/Bacterial Ig-like domain
MMRAGGLIVLVGAGLVMASAANAAPARPDLVVASVAEPPATIQVGQSFPVGSAVVNRGKRRAGKSSVSFLLSVDRRPAGADIRLPGGRAVRALKARQRRQSAYDLTVPSLTPAGVYRLIACVDRSRKVRESNERNNCRVARRSTSVTLPVGVPIDTDIPPLVPDTTAPAAPTLTGTVPATPGNDPTPNVKGIAEAGSNVTLFKQAGCAGPVDGSGTAATLADPGLTSTAVLSGQQTSFSATATDAAGNVSACSATVSYLLDDDPPPAPTIGGTDPASPSNVGAPLVQGTAEPNAGVEVFVGTVCTGAATATTTANGNGDWSVATPVSANATHSLRARQTDVAGNSSECSAPVTYVEDSIAPDTPFITSTLPASPSGDDQPAITASGTAGLVVRIYATPCTGPPIGTGTAVDPGGEAVIALAGPLPEGTNNLRADTVDAAGNRSSCSAIFPYVVDTTDPPAPVLQATTPASPGTSNVPGIRGVATEATGVDLYEGTGCGGSPVATGTPGQLAAAAGIVVPAQLNGTTKSYTAKASDDAGNVSVCSNALAYTERRATASVTEVEPNQNDVQANAQGITFSEDHLVSGTFAGDQDVFKYRAAAAQLVRFELFAGGAELCNADNQIAGMTNGPFPTPPADTGDLGIDQCGMWTTVLPGDADIFPIISGPNPSSYLLEVRRITVAGEESEPNNDAGSATPFPAGNDIAMEGQFGDNDNYTFTLDLPASVRIEIASRVGAAQSCEGSTLAAALQITNSGGFTVATDSGGGINNCAIVDGIGAAPTDVGMANLPAGTYTILAAGTAGANYSLVLTKR